MPTRQCGPSRRHNHIGDIMAWLYIRLPRGTLKFKPRSQMRTLEMARHVPVLDLGVIVVSWWSKDLMLQDVHHFAPPTKPK